MADNDQSGNLPNGAHAGLPRSRRAKRLTLPLVLGDGPAKDGPRSGRSGGLFLGRARRFGSWGV